MQNITLTDVVKSNEKFGCVLEPDLKKVRDLKKINPKSAYDVTYIPLLFKHVNGKLSRVKIDFSEQLISSSAKKPQGSEDDNKDVSKYMNIAFSHMDRETIAKGDYVPKEKDDEKEQEKENKRVSDNIDRYMKQSELFLKVLDIIDESYKQVCKDLEQKEKTLNFRLKKDRKQTDIIINSIKQSTRFDKETQKDVELENPIYRIKIPVCKKEDYLGRIGIWSTYSNEFKEVVFDARKMTKKNNYMAVPAKNEITIPKDKVKEYKKQGIKVYSRKVENDKQYYILEDLTLYNAGEFITYKSLIGGTICIESISSSKFGLSLGASFYDLYVFRHKSKEMQNNSKEFAKQLRGNADEEEEDLDEEDNDDECKKLPDITDVTHSSDEDSDSEEDNDDGNTNDAEPEDSDEEQTENDEDEEIEVKKKRGK